jgi:hypothetical protein
MVLRLARLLAPLAFALAAWPGRPAAPTLAAQAPGASPADSVVRDGVVYRGRLAVVPGRAGPALDVRVLLRSLRADAVTLEGESANCNPPLYFRRLPRGRWVAWSDRAWQADAARRAARGRFAGHASGYVCGGVGLGVELAPGARGEWEPRRYPLRAVRGDSLPAGWYAAAVGVVVYGPAGPDTLRVPAGRVRLP